MSSLGFSYAQAARGLTPSSNVSSNPNSSASSEHGTAKDVTQTTNTASQPKSPNVNDKTERENLSRPDTSRTPTKVSQSDTNVNDKLSNSVGDIEVEANKLTSSQTLSVDENHHASKSSDTDELTVQQTDDIKSEKPSNTADTAVEKEKTKETDDDWEKVSIPSVAAEKELKAAPLPTFNIWQQRKEAAQAKAKDQPASRPVVASAPPPKTRSQPTPIDEARKKQPHREDANLRGTGRTNSNGRPVKDSGNSVSPRSKPQQNEENVSSPPPVDVESWPTPESTLPEPGRRLSAFDKIDRSDANEAAASGRKSKWQALPFVPSVKFETQIPGRRGGRNSAGRGRTGGNAPSDRIAEKSETGTMGPPPVPKPVTDQERGRKGNAGRSVRASSVPVETSFEGVDQGRTTKGSSVLDKESDAALMSASVIEAKTPPQQDLSRSSSQHVSTTPKEARDSRQNSQPAQSPNVDVTDTSSNLPPRKEKSNFQGSDTPRSNDQPEKPQTREWTKDRNSNAQKSESWRSERRTERSERSERGRGTNYRGRGNPSGYVQNPSYTSPLPQNGFDNIKPSQGEPRSRQSSQQFASSASFTPSRNNPRSQSIPIGMMAGNFYQNAPSYSQALPSIQTDPNYGVFGQMPNAVPTGIMSAMPYNEPLNGYALFSMAVTQLEYYFSVDNLCKDMFLRKHMDSQGFVPLRVIADFKRIKQMLGDDPLSYDRLRGIAQQARNIEFVIGADGADRLRNREDWEKFVLPLEDRLPEAQNEQSEIRPGNFRRSSNNMPDFQIMNGGLRSAPPYVNGFDDSHMGYPSAVLHQQTPAAEAQPIESWSSHMSASRRHDESVSPITSPLSKIRSPDQDSRSVLGGMTNGHVSSVSGNGDNESTFPDEAVMALKVVVKDPDYDGDEDEPVDDSQPTRASGLRGGAASPEQLERMQSLRFRSFASTQSKNSEQTMYNSQEGPPSHLMRPGYIHEDYLSLREKAISQRADDHLDGATGVLYSLWAEFLPRPNQFNVGMYEDFKTWALEDMERGSENGKKHLVNFYETVLCAKTATTERLAADIVSVARSEVGGSRPTWLKLRAAWRNGATNLKTRKRLTELLTSEEQAELERGT